MDYLHESGVSIYRRRRHRRALVTMTFVAVLLFGTVVYAASYVQGWVGHPAAKSVVPASCSSNPHLKPSGVTVNVYNASPRAGLAAAVARSLQMKGFKVATVDNDPLGQTILGVGQIRAGRSGAAGAILAAKRLVGATIVQDDRRDASVDIVLGNKFKGLQVPSKSAVSKAGTLIPGCSSLAQLASAPRP